MAMLKDLPELIAQGVISQDTADRIQVYYRQRGGPSSHRLFIAFGILGAVLVGLGIILIIAHNWDELSRTVKTGFAFLPLLIGQLMGGFVLLKKRENPAWRESAAVFLFFAVGAALSLVSQIYNIPGDLSSFLLTWMLLSFPIIYVLDSSMASLLYMVGITYYAADEGYGSYPTSESYLFWLLLLVVLPHYYLLFRNRPKSNFTIFHNWFIPLSITIVLGTVARGMEEFMFVAYVSLFGLFYLVGGLEGFRQLNSYRMLGSLGTLSILLGLSFNWFWEALREETYQLKEVLLAPEFFAVVVLTGVAAVFLFRRWRRQSMQAIDFTEGLFLLFLGIFIIGLFSPFAAVLINLAVLGIGVVTIRTGAAQDHLGILNYGLLIIAALVLCRFFDTDLNFVLRGILFIAVGIGFFAANYWMLRKRKTHE